MIFLTALTDTARQGARAFETGGRRLNHQAVSVRGSPGAGPDALVALRRAQTGAGRQLPATARRLEQLRDDLVHMIVHDMRSPLMRAVRRPESVEPGVPPLTDRAVVADLAGRHRIDPGAQPDDQRAARREQAGSRERCQSRRRVWDLTGEWPHEVGRRSAPSISRRTIEHRPSKIPCG